MTRLDPNRPTVSMALPLVRAVYSQPWGGVGCCLHVVLDDGNYEDSIVAFCYETAVKAEHRKCIDAASMLLKMSKTQRAKVAQLR